jgi:glycosyltransferase involved in cell wall biosynthesis
LVPKLPKVLMLVQNLPAPADPRVWAEATTLRDAGFRVSIICPKGRTHQERHSCIDGIHIYRYRVTTHAGGFKGYCLEYCISLLMTCWLSLKVLLRHGFDVIHAANPPDVFFILGIFYRLFGKMYVFDQHDPVPEMFRAKFEGSSVRIHKLLLFLEYCNYRTSHLVITSNLSQKRFAIERGHCSPERVIVVRNGPDLHHMCPVPPDPELKVGRRYLLAYVGVMGTQDGIEITIYALHHLVYERGRQDVSLVLVGDGDCVPSLAALVHTLHLESFVHFAGWVNPENIPRYLSTADVGLVPDLRNGMNEFCTMIKTMEYMAFGKPIVAFDLAETRFSAQEAALYAIPNRVEDFAQKIEILLDDEDARHRMGAIGIRRVREELSWEHSKEYLLAAYKMLFPSVPIASKVTVACPGTLGESSTAVSDSASQEPGEFIALS